MPSTGAPARPVATFQVGLIVRCRKLTCPMKTKPITMSTTPAIRVMRSSHGRSSSPAVPNSRLNDDEDQAESEDEQGDADQQPAAAGALAGVEAADVAEVAGNQRQDARRGERDQPGEDRDRDREQEVAA